MPTYDYLCTTCDTRFESQHSVRAPHPVCPACGGSVRRLFLTAPAVHGHMARGRELAVNSLDPGTMQPTGAHGANCPCCRRTPG